MNELVTAAMICAGAIGGLLVVIGAALSIRSWLESKRC